MTLENRISEQPKRFRMSQNCRPLDFLLIADNDGERVRLMEGSGPGSMA